LEIPSYVESYRDAPYYDFSVPILKKHSIAPKKLILLLKNLGIKPVKKRQDISNNQNPNKDGERFVETLTERRTVFSSLASFG